MDPRPEGLVRPMHMNITTSFACTIDESDWKQRGAHDTVHASKDCVVERPDAVRPERWAHRLDPEIAKGDSD